MGNQLCKDLPEQLSKDALPSQHNQVKINGDDHYTGPKQDIHGDANNKNILAQLKEEPNYSQSHNRSYYIEQSELDPIELPQLPPKVQHRIEKEKFLTTHLKNTQLIPMRYGKDIYIGQMTEDAIPEGNGKLYKEDGSFYVGDFRNGKPEGKGTYIMENGDYYQGNFHNNQAHGQGRFEGEGYSYDGHFQKSKFHGHGEEKGENYEFKGEYYCGGKAHGVLKWWDEDGKKFSYKGKFNFKNQFHGMGVLREQHGTYQGQFKNGMKEGKGIYTYNNGLRYQGNYKDGVKQGHGTIFNHDNSISYEGEFDEDLPHGKGHIYNGNKKLETLWDHGIDKTQNK